MTVTYHFTDEEKELIEELNKRGNKYNFSQRDDLFRETYKTLLLDFRHHNLIYNSNPDDHHGYIQYKVSKKGLEAFKLITS